MDAIDVRQVNVATDVDVYAKDVDEIIRNVRVILTTFVGTVPFDRDSSGCIRSPVSRSPESAYH